MDGKAKVALVKGKSRVKNIAKALSLIKEDLGDINKVDEVWIKPNLTALNCALANTSASSVEEVIKFLNANFDIKRIVLIEGGGEAYYKGYKTSLLFDRFGYTSLTKYDNVTLRCVDDCKYFFKVPIKTIFGGNFVRVVSEVHSSYLISLAIPKTHDVAIATFGIKNIMGLIKQEDKCLMHGISKREAILRNILAKMLPPQMRTLAKKLLKRVKEGEVGNKYIQSVKLLNQNLFSLAKHVKPNLVILDGFEGMEGDGPIDGDVVKHNICIASTDALKADALGARVIGFDPQSIGYLHYISEANLGDASTKNLIGDDIKDCIMKYKPHSKYKLQQMWK